MKQNVVICKDSVFGYYGSEDSQKQWFITDRKNEILLSDKQIKEMYFQFNENSKGLK